MKKMRKILSALLAMSMVFTLLAVSASAAGPDVHPVRVQALTQEETDAIRGATVSNDKGGKDYPVEIHVMTEDERSAFEQQTEHTPINGTAFLARNNAAGTNGNICASFTAELENVAIVLVSVPGATDYNIQLYEGAPGEGIRVSNYATVGVNNGAYFSGLTKGQEYYFKVSSNTLPTSGCTARYTMIQY